MHVKLDQNLWNTSLCTGRRGSSEKPTLSVNGIDFMHQGRDFDAAVDSFHSNAAPASLKNHV